MLWSTVFVVLFCLISFQGNVEAWIMPRGSWGHFNRGKSCDSGWMEFKNHCYFLSSFRRYWHDAESYCKNHNSHLVKIETAKENDWITTKMSTLKYGNHVLWAGGNDINNEGTWRWTSDSSCFTYTNWDNSFKEPNGGKRENCLNIIHDKGSSRNGQWNDMPCNRDLFFMCEKKRKNSKIML